MGILFVKANFCFAENFKLSFPQQVVSLSSFVKYNLQSQTETFQGNSEDEETLVSGLSGDQWRGSGYLTRFITFQTCCCRYKKDAGTQWIHSPSGQVIVTAICSFYFLDCSWLQLTISSHRAGRKGTGASA